MYNLQHFKVKWKPLYIILQQVKQQELQFCHQKDQLEFLIQFVQINLSMTWLENYIVVRCDSHC